MSGARVAHYTRRLPIRWPHGESVTWKRRSLARSTFRYLCCYFHFTRPRASDVFNKPLIRDTTAAAADDFKSQKQCFDVKLFSFLLPHLCTGFFVFSCVYLLYNAVEDVWPRLTSLKHRMRWHYTMQYNIFSCNNMWCDTMWYRYAIQDMI